jgi:hypothetical protein
LLGENFNQPDPTQRITWDVTLRADQANQELDSLNAKAMRVADSLSALSSGYLNNLAATQAAATAAPQVGVNPLAGGMFTAGMIPQNAMAMQNAVAMGGAFSPQAIMARDATMMQLSALGPSTGMGPSLTTPWGDPTVNFTRGNGASPFRMNLGYLPFQGPPGAPGDPRRGDFFFSDRSGSMLDTAGMLFGRMTGYGIANDNLEDRMIRNIERRMSHFGENVSGLARFGVFDMGGSLAGSAVGSLLMPGVGTVAGGLVGGLAGGIANQTFGRISQPFVDMGKDFKQYTAPYIRGNRLGGGIDEKERFDVQEAMARRVAEDKWFTSREYQDLVSMAGETGLFQYTGNKEQALRAVDKLGESVKALYALGVKSREMLGEIDKMAGTFGMNPGKDPAQIANFYATMAVSAQSAGMSTAQMTTAVAPAAQMFANQGLGFATGARIAAMNLGAAGDMFRSGRLGAFENTYYGGKEGFANALTQAQAASFRTPIGETYLMSLFGDNMRNLNKMLNGETLSINDMMRGAGKLASQNPGEFMGIRARMPWLMQGIPGERLALGDLQNIIAEYRTTFGKKKGPVNSLELLNYMIVSRNMDPTAANAMLDFGLGAEDAAEGKRRAAGDQMEIQRIEAMRAPGLTRKIENAYESYVAAPFTTFKTGLDRAGASVGKDITEMLTGVHVYNTGADGMNVYKPFAAELAVSRAEDRVRNIGLTPIQSLVDQHPAVTLAQSTEEAARGLFGGKDVTARTNFDKALSANGVSPEEAALFRKIVTEGKAEMRLAGPERAALDRAAMETTGASSAAAAQAQILQDAQARERFAARARRDGFNQTFADAYLEDRPVVVSRQDLPTAVGDRLTQALAASSGRKATAGLLDPANQEIVNRLADHDQAGAAAAEAELRRLGYTQEEIDTFRQVTYQDKLDHGMDAFGLPKARGLDDRRTALLAEGSARTFRRRNLSPERFQQMLDIYDRETRQKQETFRVNNLDFVKGIQASQDGSDGLLSSMSADVVRQLQERGDMGAIEKAITGDRETTLDNLAPLIFQHKRSELSNQQLYQLGGVVDQLRKQGLGRDKRGMLDDLAEGALKDPGDPRMIAGEKLEDEIRKRSRELGTVGQRLLGSSAKAEDAVEAGNIYLRKAVADIIRRSSGYADAREKLASLGVTEDQYAQYGIDVDRFRDTGNRYALEYQQNVVNQALGKLGKERQKDFIGMDDDFNTMFPDPMGGFKAIKGLVQLQSRKAELAPVALSSQDIQDLSLRFGTDRLGGVSLAGYGMGGTTWQQVADKLKSGNIGDTRAVIQALMSDEKVKSKLDPGGMEAIIAASGKLAEGKALSDDEMLGIFKQIDPKTTLKDVQLLREDKKARDDALPAGERRGEVGIDTDVLNSALSHALKGGMMPHTTVGDKLGSNLDPEVRAAMIKAFDQQMALAQQMEQIGKAIDPTRQNELMAAVKQLVSADGKGGIGEALKAYSKDGKALDVNIVGGMPEPVHTVVSTGSPNEVSHNQAAPQAAPLKNGGVAPKGPVAPKPSTARPTPTKPKGK